MINTERSKVFCVIPVHNRLELTKQCLKYLADQDYPALHLVIVAGGSTDGTRERLAQFSKGNISVLRGDGSLWWGGAMRKGMEFVAALAGDRDYLLMLNDDVRIERNYVSALVRDSSARGGAVVGSAQYDEATGELTDCGYRVDFWGMRFVPLECASAERIDALPGRGVLFPYAAVRCAGNLSTKLFPHYLTDLEYSCRVREKGWELIVSRDAAVFTSSERSDKKVLASGWVMWRLSWRSRYSLIQRLLFFSLRGPWLLRLVALPRYFLVGGWRGVTRLATENRKQLV